MLGRLGRLARAPFGRSKSQRARKEVARGAQLLRKGELADAMKALNRAAALFAIGRFEEAIDVYNIALRKRPDLPDAWYFKGRALLEQSQPKAAAICLKKAVDLRPDFPEAAADLERARSEEDDAR